VVQGHAFILQHGCTPEALQQGESVVPVL
jgi:hypothetical protein